MSQKVYTCLVSYDYNMLVDGCRIGFSTTYELFLNVHGLVIYNMYPNVNDIFVDIYLNSSPPISVSTNVLNIWTPALFFFFFFFVT